MWWFRKPVEPKPGTHCARNGHFFGPRWFTLWPAADPRCQVCHVLRSDTRGY